MNHRLSKTIIALIAMVTVFTTGFSSFADAATYYVRKDGNSGCNGLTDAGGSSGNCAKLTIQAALNIAKNAGDTVTVHAGTYAENLSSVASGTSNNLITVQAYPGETVTIKRMTLSHNYNKINGFRITDSGSYDTGGVQLDGNYNQASHNTILGNSRADSGSGIGIVFKGSHNTASYNTLDGLNNGENTSFSIGFYIEGAYNEITYNTIKDTNSIERVFELYGSFNRIANNEVRNVRWTIGDGSHPDIFQTFGTAGSHDHVIENNYFHDFDGQLGNLEQNGNASAWYNWTFRNNIFANIAMELFIYFPLNFYNNTFYRCTNINTGWPLYPGYGVGKVTSLNNAFIACGTNTSNGWWNSSGGSTGDYDFVSHTATGGAKTGFSEAHGLNGGNPQFTAVFNNCSSNTCNFHVGATSALINKATVVSGYTTDKDGNARTGTWDIGAYEFNSASSDLSPSDLSPPQALRVVQ